MNSRSFFALVIMLAIFAGGAFLLFGTGGQEKASVVKISDAMASPVPGNEKAVIISLTFQNMGVGQTIVGASSPDAKTATISGTEEGRSLVLPAMGTASFSTDGAHLMLMDVEGALQEGRLIPVKITLAPGGDVVTKVRFVKDAMAGHGMMMKAKEAKPNGQMDHSKMDHSKMDQDTIATKADDAAKKMPMKAMVMTPFAVPEGEPKPSIKLAIKRGADRKGWVLKALTEDFEFSEAMADGDHKPGMGHGHIYLNGLKLGRLFGSDFTVGELPKGQHILRVTLNTNNHRAYMVGGKKVSAMVNIRVDD